MNDNEIEEFYCNRYPRKDLDQFTNDQLEEVLLEWSLCNLLEFLPNDRYDKLKKELVQEIIENNWIK